MLSPRDIAVSEIVKALNDSGVPAPYAADSWSRESVVYLLEDRICRDTVVPAAESCFINYSGQKLFYVKSAGSIAIFNLKTKKQEDINLKKALKKYSSHGQPKQINEEIIGYNSSAT